MDFGNNVVAVAKKEDLPQYMICLSQEVLTLKDTTAEREMSALVTKI
jgi:hypothetical protein